MMSRNLATGDVVVFTTLPASGRTYELTELDPDPSSKLVRIWPTDPADDRPGQWVSSSLLRLSDNCPEHCPRCGINLKVEGYPLGHQNDDGEQCEWSWNER